jgi:hypothetical protein
VIAEREAQRDPAVRKAQNELAEAKKRHNGADETVKHKEVENHDHSQA